MNVKSGKLVATGAMRRFNGAGHSALCTLVLVFFLFGAAYAPTLRGQGYIQTQAIDLADTTPGQDLWQYQYVLSGFTFQTGQGFSVFFDPLLYTDLQNPQPSLSPLWSVLAVQPDVILNQPGFFDSQALVNSPSLTDIFRVDFVWLGQGAPGLQTFNTYAANFSTLSSGSTVVPEPHALALLSLGVLCIVGARKSCFKKASNFKA